MSTLIVLIRHGESADKQPGQHDFDRVLTERGRFSVMQLARYFHDENILPVKVISSHAVRAKQTAELFCQGLNFPVDRIEYESSLFNGTDVDYWNAVMSRPSILVGHNPAISFILGKIVGDHSVSLLPGQAAIVELVDKSPDAVEGRLIKLIGPFTNIDAIK